MTTRSPVSIRDSAPPLHGERERKTDARRGLPRSIVTASIPVVWSSRHSFGSRLLGGPVSNRKSHAPDNPGQSTISQRGRSYHHKDTRDFYTDCGGPATFRHRFRLGGPIVCCLPMADPDGYHLISECIRQTSAATHRQERKRRLAAQRPERACVKAFGHPRRADTMMRRPERG